MNEGMKAAWEQALLRLKDVEGDFERMSESGVSPGSSKYADLGREYARLRSIVELGEKLKQSEKALSDARLFVEEEEGESRELAKKMLVEEEDEQTRLFHLLTLKLIPPDPNDDRTTLLELRAGTGGTEAALFVADCLQMYRLFASRKGWSAEVLSFSESDLGGMRECVLSLSGVGVYRYLRHEGGTHRVQRIPRTEARGRIHTSAITVAVMLEPDDQDIDLPESELRIDTLRSSGAGGQHVNTTESAVRILHIPTEISSFCQQERSQQKNLAMAMRVLKARVAQFYEEKQRKERSEQRNAQVGSGDRSERIRTYNFPQNRITDHRIQFTRYNLDRVCMGELEEVTESLMMHYQNSPGIDK